MTIEKKFDKFARSLTPFVGGVSFLNSCPRVNKNGKNVGIGKILLFSKFQFERMTQANQKLNYERNPCITCRFRDNYATWG